MKWSRLLVVALFAATACSKCGKTSSGSVASVERVLPARAETIIIVPSMSTLGDKLAIVEKLKIANFLAQLQNMSSAHEYVDALIAQLGLDIRKKESLEKVGVDPARPAGAAASLNGDRLLAVPVRDERRFDALLSTVARQRLGTAKATETVENGVTVHRFVTDAGVVRLEYVLTQGYALVTTPGSLKLSTLAVLPENESLAADKAYAAALTRLPAARDVIVYFPPGSDTLMGAPVGSLTWSASLTPTAFTVDVDAPVGDKSLTGIVESQTTTSLVSRLPDDAFLVARSAGDAGKLQPFADFVLGSHVRKAFAEGGFDLKTQVLANLKPGSVAGVSLAPTAKMQGMPELDLKRTNPFTYFHLSGVAAAKDAATVPATLEKLSAVAPRFGATITKEERAGQALFVTRYAQGEGVHFAQQGESVFFGSPLTRVDALLKGGEHQPIADPALKAFLDQQGLGAVIDLRKLSDAVKALPSEAWGIGGFAIKATTVRWLDATDDLKAITAGASAKDGVVSAQLQLKLTPAP